MFGPFDRSEAFLFLLFEGHGSRFGEEFLCYVNDPATKWAICIGVPYGKTWQVKDRKEQNLTFKFYKKLQSQMSVRKKQSPIDHCMPSCMTLQDCRHYVHWTFCTNLLAMSTQTNR